MKRSKCRRSDLSAIYADISGSASQDLCTHESRAFVGGRWIRQTTATIGLKSLVLAATSPNDPQWQRSFNPSPEALHLGLIGARWAAFTAKTRPNQPNITVATAHR
jgi:hypothetical protein